MSELLQVWDCQPFIVCLAVLQEYSYHNWPGLHAVSIREEARVNMC